MIAESLVNLSLITEAQKGIELLKQEIALLGAENEERINNLDALSVQLSELEKTVKRHDLEIGSLKEGVGSLKEGVGSLKESMDVEVGSLKRRMGTVENSIPSK